MRTVPPKIRMNKGKILYVNRSALFHIGSPKYMFFWWSEREKMLLIGGSDVKIPQSYKVSDCCYRRTSRSAMNIRESGFLRKVLSFTKWQADGIYNVRGEYFPELNMVGFRVNDIIIPAASDAV